MKSINHWIKLHIRAEDACFAAFFFITFSLIYGCAAPKVQMYKDEELGKSKQAIITVEKSEKSHGELSIVRVDGKQTVEIYAPRFFGLVKYANEVSVLPGKHRIVIEYSGSIGFYRPEEYAFGHLWVLAEAGEIYIIKKRLEGYSVKMWLENIRDGKKVGGYVGSDDEPK